MEVSVERYQRKKYVSQENSPVLYYIRQKAGTAKIMDIDALAEDIQTNCALTTGDVKHTIEALVEQLRKVLTQGNNRRTGNLPHDADLPAGRNREGVHGEEYQAGERAVHTR